MENDLPKNVQELVTKKELEQLLTDQTGVILQAVDERFTAQQKRIDQRFAAVDRRFDGVDDRFSAHELRMDKIEQKLDDKFDTVITKLDGVMKELQAHRVEDVFGANQLRRHDDQLTDHEGRIKDLELQPQRVA